MATVLASSMFARSSNLSKILSYICARYFAGQEASLKEYTIGVEALGRGPDFHPDRDSIVRVEATRLRKRLKRYYETEGASHAIHIALPETGYVPQFLSKAASAQAREESGGPKPSVPRRVLLAAGSIFAIGLAAILARLSRPHSESATGAGDAMPAGHEAPAALTSVEEVRILAGHTGPKYIDIMGRTWFSDRWFTGGRAFARHAPRIFRTLDQGPYQTGRMGDFRYDIPLKPGIYELHLHFAETQYGGTTSLESGIEGLRRFHVLLNGQPLLTDFDITVSAGAPSTADERVFIDVMPTNDGLLHLEFSSYHGAALLNAIEILPGVRGRMRPVRILAGSHSYVDRHDQFWGADRYFLGGRVSRLSAPVEAPDDQGLYGNARWGHFTYAIPVASGRYTATLRFAEPTYGHTGDGSGRRLFDVYCNGSTLLKSFDIYREAAGANRALIKRFRALEPNAQGKLLFWFIPLKDYANVFAIEVAAE